jgi:uncharacterized protein YndB with AHSA1/START domain
MATVTIAPDQNTIFAEIFIAAPPARVFEAITDPNQMPQWWGQHGIHRITAWKADLRPGGKWSSVGAHADGTPFTIEGEYLEIDPPRLLVHTWIPSWTGPLQTVVRWELEPHAVHGLHPSGPRKAGTGTLLKVRQEGFASAPAHLAGHSEGWKRVLGWLQGFVERGETVEARKETTHV